MALLALVVLAALLRIPTLGQQGYWYDESRTIVVIHASFTQMIHNVYSGATTPELYFIFAWAWSQIIGFGAFGIRFLSAVCGILTVPVVFLIGRKMGSRRAGVIAAALTTCSPMLIWYSQEARTYSLMVLLSALGFLAFISLLEQPASRLIVAWVLISGLALSTHYYSALSIVPEAAWLAWRHRRFKRIWVGLAIVCVWAGALVPQEAHQARWVPGGGWISSIPLGTRMPAVLIQQLLGPSRLLTPVTLTLDLLVIGLAVFGLYRHRDALRQSVPAIVVVLTGAVIFALSILTGHDLLDPRNVLAVWTPLIVALSIGLARIEPVSLRTTAAAVMCAVGIFTVVAVDADSRLQRPAWGKLASTIHAQHAGAVFEAYGCETVPLELYLPSAWETGSIKVTSLDVVTTAPQPTKYDVLMKNWYTVCGEFSKPVAIPATIDGLRRTGAPQHIGPFTLQRYTSKTPQVISEPSVAQGMSPSGILWRVRLKPGPRPLA